MKFAISPLIESVQFPPITELRGFAASYAKGDQLPLIDLCQAVPDYAPATELTTHLATLLADPLTSRYTPDEGLPQVREAMAARYRRLYGGSIAAGNICLTAGASQAFWLAITTLCQAGDEVIVQTPYYFDHDMGLATLGIKRVYAPFNPENGGIPSVEAIFRLVSAKTKAILLVTPSNPTGAVIPPKLLQELHDLAVYHDIALILDETYADFIISNAAPHNLFTDPAWGENLIHIASLGKTYSLTGYRAGLMVASENFIHHALKAQDSMVVCQPRITQLALLYAAGHLDRWVCDNAAMMERRHNLFIREFAKKSSGFELVASGSFFAWIRHPFTDLDSRGAARRLLDESGLLTLPGEAFGSEFSGYLRLALGNINEDLIPEAVRRLHEYR